MVNKYTKRCLTALVVREMQVYTTTRYYYFLPTKMATAKNKSKC